MAAAAPSIASAISSAATASSNDSWSDISLLWTQVVLTVRPPTRSLQPQQEPPDAIKANQSDGRHR